MRHWKQRGWVSQAAASSSGCSAKAAQHSTTPHTAAGPGKHRGLSLPHPSLKAKLLWDLSLVLKTLGIITGDGYKKDFGKDKWQREEMGSKHDYQLAFERKLQVWS